MENTGMDKYRLVGIVHRGEIFSPCTCGGTVNAYCDGELIAHTAPMDWAVEHVAVGSGTPILFKKEAIWNTQAN